MRRRKTVRKKERKKEAELDLEGALLPRPMVSIPTCTGTQKRKESRFMMERPGISWRSRYMFWWIARRSSGVALWWCAELICWSTTIM